MGGERTRSFRGRASRIIIIIIIHLHQNRRDDGGMSPADVERTTFYRRHKRGESRATTHVLWSDN